MGRITWHTFVFLVVGLVTWFFVDGKLGSHEATKLVSVELFIHLYTNISNLLCMTSISIILQNVPITEDSFAGTSVPLSNSAYQDVVAFPVFMVDPFTS